MDPALARIWLEWYHRPMELSNETAPAGIDIAARAATPLRRDQGFILIPVLLILGLLAVASLILTRTVATDVKASANLLTRAEAETLSDGIARLTMRYVLANRIDGRALGAFDLDGTPLSCVTGNSIATISINSTAGLIDINAAGQDVLEKLFTGIGAPAPQTLAAAVIDFRDPDDVALPGGAEAADYLAAGLKHGPKNAPFTTVAELDQVLGMTPELYARARPLVTANSGLSVPDPAVASPGVLALSLPSELSTLPRTRHLRIRASVRRLNNPRSYTREAVVLLEARIRGGYMLKSWERSELSISPSGAIDANGLPSCIDGLLAVDR